MRPGQERLDARLRLTRLAIGGWAAQTLFAANNLGVFDALHKTGPSSSEALAEELGLEPDATRRLLGALVAIDMLESGEGLFRNSLAAEEFLVPGTAESMTTWVNLIGSWNQTFGRLPDSVRTGQPAEIPEDHLGDSPEDTRTFILGMHDYAVGPGRELSRFLDLKGRRRLLDVGGGPGTYSILLAAANPDLTCTVFDLPSVVPIAEEVIERHDLTARVSTVGGDYHSDAFPRSFDVVLVSNTLHQEDEATCKRILSQAYESLEDGGICVVHAMPMNERQDGPVWPALHNLLMLLIYRGGRAYTQGQYCELMTGAGFSDVGAHTMSVFNAGMFIVGRR